MCIAEPAPESAPQETGEAGRSAAAEPMEDLVRALVWRPGALWALCERAPHDEAAREALRLFCLARDEELRHLNCGRSS